MLEWLKNILADNYTEDIDKQISQEIGRNFVSRSDFNAKSEALKAAERTVAERDGQLETLKKFSGDTEDLKQQIADLQNQNAEAKKTYDAEIKKLKIDAAVELALSAAKAKNVRAVKALLDLDKAELAEDGTVKGLIDQIKKLTAAPDSNFLFEADTQNKFEGLKPGESMTPVAAGELTLEGFRKLPSAERLNFAQKHPEEYKKLYDGGMK